ncbi:sterol carrier family protein [Nesterenkonia aerolata]|uniref:Sterol carrier family protein n=1 Tax=Nesterenkonia aerolata TaxID=3074079 RepID=A0ABU2DSA8_9MICC|nr:sterol carrier family protein [Nesterenkonia sp. LY-0111]MDR8019260.1 sterol carrier family protein [Nesterenkonia sp. LY-0111]
MARRRITPADGRAAVEAWAGADQPDRRTTATAVRFLLEELAERAPGNSVEVRVPPFGVTQCVEGPAHTRGTPPNVVELAPVVWLDLATGHQQWQEALAAGNISASGVRADLSDHLPLMRVEAAEGP